MYTEKEKDSRTGKQKGGQQRKYYHSPRRRAIMTRIIDKNWPKNRTVLWGQSEQTVCCHGAAHLTES